MILNLVCLSLLTITQFFIGASLALDPDADRGTVEIIQSRGFKAETHFVTTEDGYILTVHRIVNPYTRNKSPRVIILQHGLMGCSRDYVFNSPGEDLWPDDDGDLCDGRKINKYKVGNNLGMVLSKEGFDVWLPNTRGSGYSQNHTTLSTKDDRFWEFTFDQMIQYDLPAYISYILKHTKQDTLSYVGHSEGGWLMLGLLATRPEFAEIVKPYIGLAPAYSLKGWKMFFGTVKYLPYATIDLLRLIGGPVVMTEGTEKIALKYLCNYMSIFCTTPIYLSSGFDPEQINSSRVHVYITSPSQSSKWNMAHYAQILMSKSHKMEMFDLGWLGNLKKYGQFVPKSYPIGRIRSKYLALIYGKNDWSVRPEAMEQLKKDLKVPLFEDYLVPFDNWNHVDFVVGKQAGLYVNSKILKILRRALC